MAQHQAGLQLIASGTAMQLLGLVWGFNVPNTPFPRLGLTAHIQAMAEGCMLLATGLLVKQSDILELSPLQSTVVVWGMNSCWLAILSEIANSYWGTKDILPIAALAAGAKGGLAWQETIVTVSHLAAVGIVAGFGVLTYELFLGQKGLNLMGEKAAESSTKKSH